MQNRGYLSSRSSPQPLDAAATEHSRAHALADINRFDQLVMVQWGFLGQGPAACCRAGFLMAPGPETRSTLEQRLIAVAFADQVGAALASSQRRTASRKRHVLMAGDPQTPPDAHGAAYVLDLLSARDARAGVAAAGPPATSRHLASLPILLTGRVSPRWLARGGSSGHGDPPCGL